jgi:hypothetical protein
VVRINLLFLLLFIAVTTHAQQNLADFGLKGKVHSVYTDKEMPEKKTDSTWHLIDYRGFDEQGNQTVFIMYHSSFPDSVVTRSVHTYNKQGQVIADTTYGIKGTSSAGFIYNEHRQLLERSFEDEHGFMGKEVYAYNTEGRPDSILHLGSNGMRNETEVYLYNGKYPVQKNIYDSLNLLKQIIYYTDTTEKRIVEQYWGVKNTDSLRLYFTAVYAPNGEWLMHQYFWANGSSTTYQKQLNNANETMVMTTTVTKGSKKTITTRRYQYTYDDKGNWITSVSKSKGRPDLTTTRTITYY